MSEAVVRLLPCPETTPSQLPWTLTRRGGSLQWVESLTWSACPGWRSPRVRALGEIFVGYTLPFLRVVSWWRYSSSGVGAVLWQSGWGHILPGWPCPGCSSFNCSACGYRSLTCSPDMLPCPGPAVFDYHSLTHLLSLPLIDRLRKANWHLPLRCSPVAPSTSNVIIIIWPCWTFELLGHALL